MHSEKQEILDLSSKLKNFEIKIFEANCFHLENFITISYKKIDTTISYSNYTQALTSIRNLLKFEAEENNND